MFIVLIRYVRGDFNARIATKSTLTGRSNTSFGSGQLLDEVSTASIVVLLLKNLEQDLMLLTLCVYPAYKIIYYAKVG